MTSFDARVASAVADGKSVLRDIWYHLDGVEADSREGRRFALARFYAALDHVDGLLSLLGAGNVPPTLALIRPTLESLVRGMWLLHCASREQVAAFEQGQCPKIGPMIYAVEAALSYSDSALSQLEQRSLKFLHGLTHAGREIDPFMFDGATLGTSIPVEQAVEIAHWSSAMALLAAGQIASMTGNPAIVRAMVDRMQSFAAHTAVLP